MVSAPEFRSGVGILGRGSAILSFISVDNPEIVGFKVFCQMCCKKQIRVSSRVKVKLLTVNPRYFSCNLEIAKRPQTTISI